MTRFCRGLAALTSLALALLPGQLALTLPARGAAAPFVAPCVTITVTSAGFAQESCQAVTPTFGLPVNIVSGTVTASLGGFTPSTSGSRMTPLSVTTSDSSGTLPTGTVDIISNTDVTNPIYCNVLGVAATVADQKIPPNSWFAFTIPGSGTTLHCIATGGTVLANGLGGAGLATGAGGGGSGGGGGGAITSPLGAQAIVASVAVNPATSSVWAASQSGTWTVQPGNTPNTTAWLVTGTGGTFPITAASLPLPTGAATAANQSTANTSLSAIASNTGLTAAGTSAANGSGVQGMTGGVPVPTSTSVNVTHTQCDGTITTGGTAKVAIAAQTTLHGFSITNNDATSGGGEPLWISLTTTATTVGGTGSNPLSAPTALSFNGMGSVTLTTGLNHAISLIAATTGHTYGCFWW